MNNPTIDGVAAVVFDKDGTLVDFHRTWDPVVERFLREMCGDDRGVLEGVAESVGFDLTSGTLLETSPVVADSNAEVAACLAPWFGRDPSDPEFLREMEQKFAEIIDTTVVGVEGAEDLLERLQRAGVPVGLATNDSEESAVRQVASLGWSGYFASIVGYDSGHGAKPGPGMVSGSARALGVAASATMMVGDSRHDIEAGRAAGAVTVYVGDSPVLGGSADIWVRRIGEIGDLLLGDQEAVARSHLDPIPLDGPFYDHLRRGDRMPRQPGVTLDSGIAALYQSIVGERLPLCLDVELCREVTGSERPLASPGLVMQMSIGQSTTISRRAVANLFYRDLRMVSPVHLGDIISTEVTVAALSDSTPRPDRAPRGKVLVDIVTSVGDRPVVVYQRCPMLPTEGVALPGHSDDLGDTAPLDLHSFVGLIPDEWDLRPLGPSPLWAAGDTIVDPTRDVIDGATALVRLTHNLAMIHRDTGQSPYPERLVYGGHVVGLAQASLSRVLPGMATVLGWQECSHIGPAFENDLLSFSHTLVDTLDRPSGRLMAVEVSGFAHRPAGPEDGSPVLRWIVIVLVSPTD